MSRLVCDSCDATPDADDYLEGSDCPACDDGVLHDLVREYGFDEEDDLDEFDDEDDCDDCCFDDEDEDA